MRQRVLNRYSKAPNRGLSGMVNRRNGTQNLMSRMAGNESRSRASLS